MRHVLLWPLLAACAWVGFGYVYSHPRFWLLVVQGCTWVGTGALRIYTIVQADQNHRPCAGARPRTGDTITDIEEYLKRKRSP